VSPLRGPSTEGLKCPMCGEPWDGGFCGTCGWYEAKDRKPHRWTPDTASKAGRIGGQAAKRPKGMGKGKGKRRVGWGGERGTDD